MNMRVLELGRLIYVCENSKERSNLREIVEDLISDLDVNFLDMDLLYGYYVETLNCNGEIIHKDKVLKTIFTYFK